MKISEMFKKERTVFSAEVFPPKKTSPERVIYDTLSGLRDVDPDFISVTLGAGGSIKTADLTCHIAEILKKEYDIEPMVHIPAYAFGKEDTIELLNRLENLGVENILALRGDENPNHPPIKDFPHASDLTAFIKKYNPNFDIGGSCYPEVHPDAPDLETDVKNLKIKVEAGASHLVSQLFFDNNSFYTFMDEVKKQGITVPIEAGIMPVTNEKQINRMVKTCGASLPHKFVRMMQKYGNSPEAMMDAGIAYATDQIIDLLSHDVDGIHIYTMNNAEITKRIYKSISRLL